MLGLNSRLNCGFQDKPDCCLCRDINCLCHDITTCWCIFRLCVIFVATFLPRLQFYLLVKFVATKFMNVVT